MRELVEKLEREKTDLTWLLNRALEGDRDAAGTLGFLLTYGRTGGNVVLRPRGLEKLVPLAARSREHAYLLYSLLRHGFHVDLSEEGARALARDPTGYREKIILFYGKEFPLEPLLDHVLQGSRIHARVLGKLLEEGSSLDLDTGKINRILEYTCRDRIFEKILEFSDREKVVEVLVPRVLEDECYARLLWKLMDGGVKPKIPDGIARGIVDRAVWTKSPYFYLLLSLGPMAEDYLYSRAAKGSEPHAKLLRILVSRFPGTRNFDLESLWPHVLSDKREHILLMRELVRSGTPVIFNGERARVLLHLTHQRAARNLLAILVVKNGFPEGLKEELAGKSPVYQRKFFSSLLSHVNG